MSDIYHDWGTDLSASPTGDLAVASDSDSTQQQILRALMTNPAFNDAAGNPIASADYADHPTFGAGLPRKIGSVISIPAVRAICRAVVLSFPAVSRSPAPVIDVIPFNNGATISISYLNLVTGETEELNFDINQ